MQREFPVLLLGYFMSQLRRSGKGHAGKSLDGARKCGGKTHRPFTGDKKGRRFNWRVKKFSTIYPRFKPTTQREFNNIIQTELTPEMVEKKAVGVMLPDRHRPPKSTIHCSHLFLMENSPPKNYNASWPFARLPANEAKRLFND